MYFRDVQFIPGNNQIAGRQLRLMQLANSCGENDLTNLAAVRIVRCLRMLIRLTTFRSVCRIGVVVMMAAMTMPMMIMRDRADRRFARCRIVAMVAANVQQLSGRQQY